MQSLKFFGVLVGVTFFLSVRAGTSDTNSFQVLPEFNIIHNFLASNKDAEALKFLDQKLEKLKEDDPEITKLLFVKARIIENQPDSESTIKALEIVDSLIKADFVLQEELQLMRARLLLRQNLTKDAEKELQTYLKKQPNLHNRFLAIMLLSQVLIEQNKASEAKRHLLKLEKSSRETPDHVDVVWELARTEQKINKNPAKSQFCRWLKKVFVKYPAYAKAEGWGPYLNKNSFNGIETNCPNNLDDVRSRMRALIWSGREDQAKAEIEKLAVDMEVKDPVSAKELRAWILAQTGEVEKGFLMLDEIAEANQKNVSFLQVYASTAARAGKPDKAVQSQYQIYKLVGNSSVGRKALYQSAFQSYQFTDYEGASAKFSEFIRKYPRSGLSQDARWNLAWISYLKGKYRDALDQFAALKPRRKASGSAYDRALYWQAMSHYRLENYSQARKIFKQISDAKRTIYYANAAADRLEKIQKLLKEKPQLANVEPEKPRVFGPRHLAQELMSFSETRLLVSDDEEEAMESEEAMAQAIVDQDLEGSDIDKSAEPSDAEAGESKTAKQENEVSEEAQTKSNAPKNHVERFARAKLLKSLGYRDESKWELFEIEKRVRSKDELKTLLYAYEESEQFHRSVSIVQNRFGLPKWETNLNGARKFWESAYPQAFQKNVIEEADRNSIPSELIWGIMKAESQFKKDAISPVGAMGLMQIMPQTALKLAELKKTSSFESRQLLQPERAVEFGSFYLKRLNKNFEGSIPLTAAAYNAGPHRVHSWLLSFGQNVDLDEFIEHIPFLETREYVRRVVSHFITYNLLYSKKVKKINLAEKLNVKGQLAMSYREVWN